MSRVDPFFEPDRRPAFLHDALYHLVEEICWLEAVITWRLQHRIDFQGASQLFVEMIVRSESQGAEDRGESLLFELATGRRLVLS